MIEMLHCDCKEYMAGCADKAFDLAIVDPPYGIDDKMQTGSLVENKGNKFALMYIEKSWDKNRPSAEYFKELIRVSENQIIWGGNYFADLLPPSRGWICWDKEGDRMTTVNNELAWSSFDNAMSMFRRCHGLDKGFMNKEGKNIHPTQKPVALYKWLLSRYAKPGDKILDTHGGSGSICIACHDLGYDLTWMELDADYYKAACERYQNHAAQGFLFSPSTPLTPVAESPTLFGE